MPVPEYHAAVFKWPHPEAAEVIVTGEFDGWSGSRHLTRHDEGFEGIVLVPWGTRVHYKFIIDGHWTVADGQQTEYDATGNLNNVFDSPARPPTPTQSETPAAVPEPTLIEPTLPSGQANGVIATVKDAAIAIVEAITPGTTQTPAQTPAVETQPDEPEAIPVGEEAIVDEKVFDTTVGSEIVVEEEVEEVVKAETVLPAPVEEIPAAPVVPIPVLPLNSAETTKQFETSIVEGSATNQPETIVEPSTHTPVDVSKLNGHAEKALETKAVEVSIVAEPGAVQPSTHTPAPPIERPYPEASTHTPTPVHATEEVPTTNGAAAEPATLAAAVSAVSTTDEPAVNGKEEVKPEAIALPLPTPTEVPLPSSPGANGNGKTTPPPSSSVASSPQTSPRKEKKHAFPSFGRHSRRSSSLSVSTRGTVDEHGALETPSRNGTTTRKKRNSIFSKIKDIFTDHDHHEHPLPNGGQKK
ncbi:carbohydrate-binding module family 48 protein [Phlebiopsis gigantea 11061_1 CR5-6]|uniref:Carbohydrate-binding module family 48 protein n=1 Tax=Phlebiopsis gigantea (strain 11061_1 CR5-6) TaxID=745531 RepID=A0A0C3NWT1_PHLG1|nr:carbohydrate-binding module family 48 protein [Phlebiopsis gigantea 11061_1 CR5-6]